MWDMAIIWRAVGDSATDFRPTAGNFNAGAASCNEGTTKTRWIGMWGRIALLGAVVFASIGVARADGMNVIELRQAGQDLLASDFAGIRAVVAAKGDVKTLENPAKAMARWMRAF